MKTVTLGRTGITVSKHGFGALPIQRITRDEAAKLLRKAYDGGITLSIPARSFMYRPKNSPSSTRQSGVCLLSGIVNTLSHSSEKP